MEISYFGHSMFRIKGRQATLITDPFNPDMVGLKYPKVAADVVTQSHQHEDHNYLERIEDFRMVISAPGEYEISEVSILGFQTFHDPVKGEKRGKNVIFIIEMDGLRIAHLGDLGHKLSEKVIEDMGDINILMIPVGGVYTIGPKEASEVVQSIEPTVIIPMHYKLPGIKEDVFGGLSDVEEFLREMGTPVEKLEKFVVKKEDIGEEQKVVVLERK